jgi:hypothetical protein
MQTPLRRSVSSWKLSISYLSPLKTEGGTNALSGETIFFGRFDVDGKRGFTGLSSFLRDRKVLMQAAHM